LGDIVKGLSNREIGELRALTHNTVKTYIRHTYQKIGVKTRAQAVSWGLQHGFDPHRTPANASPRSEPRHA
jgi:DNA-binding NarL/FixJ family response regulator